MYSITRPLSPGSEKIEGVLFDLGHTLLYFDGDWTQSIPQSDAQLVTSLRSAGYHLDGEAFIPRFRSLLQAYHQERENEFIEYTTAYILRQVLAEYGYQAVTDEVIQKALASMYRVTQASWKPEPDAHPTLETLRKYGYRLGLISNAGDDADVQTLLDQANLRAYFEIILTSAGQGIRKPNPEIFWTALKHLNIHPGKVAMVGDTLGADILGAYNAGIYSIWITRHAESPANRAHADTIQPDAKIERLEDLSPLLACLSGSPA